MFHFTKKRAVVVVAVVGSLALSVGAYAYFTQAGSGSGSASTGSTAAVTIAHKNSPIAVLYPGTSSNVVVSARNEGEGPQYVAKVKLASVVTGDPGCDPAWFTMPDITIDQTLAAGIESIERNASLTMTDTGTNQNACQNADLVLNFTSN